MTADDVIKHFGSLRRAAIALDVWPQTIYAWGDKVPPLRQYQIEVLTDGALKADRDDQDGQ